MEGAFLCESSNRRDRAGLSWREEALTLELSRRWVSLTCFQLERQGRAQLEGGGTDIGAVPPTCFLSGPIVGG